MKNKTVKRVKGWAHLEMVRNMPFQVYIQKEKPPCQHGKDFGLECMIPCVVTYQIKAPKKKPYKEATMTYEITPKAPRGRTK